MGYYLLIMLPNHRRRSGTLPCAAPWPLFLWVREELSHRLRMREVELVHEDIVIGVYGFRARSRLPVDESPSASSSAPLPA
jgi:hypothetical protein